MSAAVIAGSFADYRLVKSRSVLQVIVEIPIEQQGAAFAALGYPLPGTEIAVAVARLNSPAGTQPQTKGSNATVMSPGKDTRQTPAGEPKDRRPWETLTGPQQAGILCADKGFQKWVSEKTGWECDEKDAASWLRNTLGIDSRRDLMDHPNAIATLDVIRAEFMEWAGRVPVAVR